MEGDFWAQINEACLADEKPAEVSHDELVHRVLFVVLSRQGKSYWAYNDDIDQVLEDALERFCGVTDPAVIKKAQEWTKKNDVTRDQLPLLPRKALVKEWGLTEGQYLRFFEETKRFLLEARLKQFSRYDLIAMLDGDEKPLMERTEKPPVQQQESGHPPKVEVHIHLEGRSITRKLSWLCKPSVIFPF